MKHQKTAEWKPTRKQAEFVKLLVTSRASKPIKDICSAIPVARSTLYRIWLNDPDFCAYLKEIREHVATVWKAQVDRACIREAIGGDVQAMHLFYKRFDDLIEKFDAKIEGKVEIIVGEPLEKV